MSQSLAPSTHLDSCAMPTNVSSISALQIASMKAARITDPAKKRGRGRPKKIQGKLLTGHIQVIYNQIFI